MPQGSTCTTTVHTQAICLHSNMHTRTRISLNVSYPNFFLAHTLQILKRRLVKALKGQRTMWDAKSVQISKKTFTLALAIRKQ